jgi:gliding motility-associated-like protein
MSSFSNRVFVVLFVHFFSFPAFAQSYRLWASYYGGGGFEYVHDIAVDASGNILIAGITESLSGVSFNGFQPVFGGGASDAFLAKIDASGNLLWATYYGGPSDDYGLSVASDPFGNIYLTGGTSSTSGIASGGFQNALSSDPDIFLVKFDMNGNRLWATYYGGPGAEAQSQVTVDNLGNVYLCGDTDSPTGIAAGGFQNTFSGGCCDAFLVKFDGAGNRLWATYFGASGGEAKASVATDLNGNVFLSGMTNSPVGLAYNGFQNALSGLDDKFLVKFNSAGSRIWSTYYGGPGDEFSSGRSIVADPSGSIFLGGATTSMTGISSQGFQNTLSVNGPDVFIVKFDGSGARKWATYYGGIEIDDFGSLAIDQGFHLYVAGTTKSPTQISTNSGFQTGLMGNQNLFAVKFDSSGQRECATYFGSADEWNGRTAVDGTGDLYISGITSSTTGISFGGFQSVYGGNLDGLVAKLSPCIPGLSAVISSTRLTCSDSCLGTSSIQASGGIAPYTYSWSNLDTGQFVSGLCEGTYSVTVADALNKILVGTIIIETDLSNMEYLLPTAFSPDENNINDRYCIPRNSCIDHFIFKIYDRWGEKVFESDNPANCWDGTYKGKILNTDVFVYYFDATLSNGEHFSQKGNISLVR